MPLPSPVIDCSIIYKQSIRPSTEENKQRSVIIISTQDTSSFAIFYMGTCCASADCWLFLLGFKVEMYSICPHFPSDIFFNTLIPTAPPQR